MAGTDLLLELSGPELDRALWPAIEAATRQCMKAEGFEYRERPWTDLQVAAYEFVSDYLDPFDSGYIREYGFGFSTLYFDQRVVGPNLLGSNLSGATDTTDPNEALLAEFGEAEREAWLLALYGHPEQIDPSIDSGAEPLIDAQPSADSCLGQAQAGSYARSSFVTEHADVITELQELVAADARMVELEEDVRRCVASKGFEYVDVDQFRESIFLELQQLRSEYQSQSMLLNLSDSELTELGQDGVEALAAEVGGVEPLSEPLRARLAVLQESEVQLATAIDECGGLGAREDLRKELTLQYETVLSEEYFGE